MMVHHTIALDDPRWQGLGGGYGVEYDRRGALRALAANWDDGKPGMSLWNELHHQGDVGEASYASVPTLVALAETATRRDWNVYALTATIEVERHRRDNPSLTEWMAPLLCRSVD